MPGPSRGYELRRTPQGQAVTVQARGAEVLVTPALNRGTAFTHSQRQQLGLTGLLPSGVSSLASQLRRVYAQYQRQPDDLAKNVYLGHLRDRNEVLFYRLLSDHLQEMLPVVYTPTVGRAIERFSHEYRRPRGVYLTVDRPQDVEVSLANFGLGAEDVDLLVATDAEGILGIGDWGVGGIEISIGKLAVYTAAAGIHPQRVIPVVLDVGTDNLELLNDEMYLGYRHARVRDDRYDELIEAYVQAATTLFPYAMLHWEDFGVGNARRVLQKYADRCCTFNDDMQGTAAVVLAAAMAATRVSGTRMRDQTVVIHGAGTAGIGIADAIRDVMIEQGLSPHEAGRRFYPVGRRGLLTTDQVGYLREFQLPYTHRPEEVAGWATDGAIGLADVVSHARPTMLVGTSTQPGAFTEPIVRAMAAGTDRPIIMPLSNPTSRAEAHPTDLIAWTEGRALVATGSPFPPVSYRGTTYQIAQANNALAFPGIGLGVAVSRASRVTDPMLAAAARAIAALCDASTPGSSLLPPVDDLRRVSAAVAIAVATTAAEQGLTRTALTNPVQQVHEAMWRPEYPQIQAG